ncbi:MAG: BON domain-containing protein [Gammaproteobacteria bacterium]|nr:BON domain-containing protein [Gammaproteobacteria bacterium]
MRLFLIATLLLGWPLAALAGNDVTVDYHSELEPASDILIADAVRTELALARHVPAGHLKVNVENGIVTMTGQSPTLLGKERALQVVKHLRGVRGVVDRISVASSGIPDGHVRTAVEAALAVDPATEPLEIDVTVEEGAVTLTGTVDSQAERAIASAVARSIVGVRAIDNRLDVSIPNRRADSEIEADVTQRLYWDVRIPHQLISVEVDGGVVYLEGAVGSLFERDMAIARAHVAGARVVDADELQIDGAARGLRRISAIVPKDIDIERALLDVFEADPRVAPFDPEVVVEMGQVTLTGTVDNPKARKAAAQAARNTVGVVAVKNLIEVEPRSPLSDADLDRYVSIALDRDVFVTDQPIDVTVDDAVVTLDGTVDTFFERAHAEDVASRMVSVREVINELRVTYPVPLVSYAFFDWDPLLDHYAYDRTLVNRLPDETIRRNILRELYWSPYVDSGEIIVFVKDGVATLRGIVPSSFAVRDAIQSAFAGGAIDVQESLRVEDIATEPVAIAQ